MNSSLVTDASSPQKATEQDLEEISIMIDYLDQLLEKKLAENDNQLTDEDKQLILNAVFEKYGVGDSNHIINTNL